MYKGHTCTACARALQAREACVHIESTRWACALNALQCTTRARVSPRQLHKAVACTPSRNAVPVHIKRTTRAGASNARRARAYPAPRRCVHMNRAKCARTSGAQSALHIKRGESACAHQAHTAPLHIKRRKCTCTSRRVSVPSAQCAPAHQTRSLRVTIKRTKCGTQRTKCRRSSSTRSAAHPAPEGRANINKVCVHSRRKVCACTASLSKHTKRAFIKHIKRVCSPSTRIARAHPAPAGHVHINRR